MAADAFYGIPAPPPSQASTDLLGVLTSTHPVVELGELAWINPEGLDALQEQLLAFAKRGPTWDTRYHFFDGTERTVNWLLLLDALNFCFWAEAKIDCDKQFAGSHALAPRHQAGHGTFRFGARCESWFVEIHQREALGDGKIFVAGRLWCIFLFPFPAWHGDSLH